MRAVAVSGGQGTCALGLEWGFGLARRWWAVRLGQQARVLVGRCGARRAGGARGGGSVGLLRWLGQAGHARTSRPEARGLGWGWFGYLGQMPLFFFLCLLFFFYFLFLSYSMPWVSHIGLHGLPTRLPPRSYMCVPACINNMLTHRGGLLGVLGFRDSGPMVGTNINGKSGFLWGSGL